MTASSLRRGSLFAALTIQSVVLAAVSTATASVINWSGPANITGDADVSTNGTLIGAFNLGDTGIAGATVNGVAFQGFAVPTNSTGATVGNFAVASGLSFFSDNITFGSPSAPFSNLSAPYQTLLQSGVTIGEASFTLTMSGLTVGTQYEFQWWANISLDGSDQHSASAVNTVTLQDNTSGLDGGLGQYVIGTFIADSTSQVVTFSLGNNSAFALLNAFQLRQAAPAAAVPEPGTAFAGLMLAGLVGLRRRRSK